MYSLNEIEKQQVGLRLPKYLVDDIEELTKSYSLNKTDIITEAIRSYVQEQKTKIFYEEFNSSCSQVKDILEKKTDVDSCKTLEDLIDELKDN